MSNSSPTRRELEGAVRRFVGDTSSVAETATSRAKAALPAVGVLGALFVYVLGRRRGRKRSATVEVRRR